MRLFNNKWQISQCDDRNIVVYAVKIVASGDNIGKERLDIKGYYSKIEQALQKVVDLEVRELVECETSSEAIQELERIKGMIEAIKNMKLDITGII